MAMPMSPFPEDDEEKRLRKTLDKSCAGCERTRTGKMFTSALAGLWVRTTTTRRYWQVFDKVRVRFNFGDSSCFPTVGLTEGAECRQSHKLFAPFLSEE
jgi:hypothetical protein